MHLGGVPIRNEQCIIQQCVWNPCVLGLAEPGVSCILTTGGKNSANLCGQWLASISYPGIQMPPSWDGTSPASRKTSGLPATAQPWALESSHACGQQSVGSLSSLACTAPPT